MIYLIIGGIGIGVTFGWICGHFFGYRKGELDNPQVLAYYDDFAQRVTIMYPGRITVEDVSTGLFSEANGRAVFNILKDGQFWHSEPMISDEDFEKYRLKLMSTPVDEVVDNPEPQ